MKISGPLAFHDEERFVDRPLGIGAAVDGAAAAAAGGTGAAAGPARSPSSLGSIRGRSGSGSSNAEGNTGADASRSGAAGQAITTTFTSLSDGRIIEQQVTLNPGGPGILSPEVIRSGKSMLYG